MAADDLDTCLLGSSHKLLGSCRLLILADTCGSKALCGVAYSNDNCLYSTEICACSCRVVSICNCLKSLHYLLDHRAVCALAERCYKNRSLELLSNSSNCNLSVFAVRLILILGGDFL